MAIEFDTGGLSAVRDYDTSKKKLAEKTQGTAGAVKDAMEIKFGTGEEDSALGALGKALQLFGKKPNAAVYIDHEV